MAVIAAVAIGASGAAPALGEPAGPYVAVAPFLAADFAPSTPTATPTPTTTPTPEGFEVMFFDVGQGDASLVMVGGQRLLIDAGGDGSLAVTRLHTWGVHDLDAILATHPDDDHIGGFAAILEAFEVETVYLNGETSGSQAYADFMAAVNAEGAQVITLRRGDSIPLGGLELPVLHPPEPLSGNSNDDSIVVRLSCESIDVLFTGDVEAAAEASMLAAGLVPDLDVLKVANHGANTSTTAPLLAQTEPRFAVISAAAGNPPHADVLDRLDAVDARLQYTDLGAGDDSLVLTSDCRTYEFSRE
jgi:beta-lactamase superfamily II metal-dependent hydrolase